MLGGSPAIPSAWMAARSSELWRRLTIATFFKGNSLAAKSTYPSVVAYGAPPRRRPWPINAMTAKLSETTTQSGLPMFGTKFPDSEKLVRCGNSDAYLLRRDFRLWHEAAVLRHARTSPQLNEKRPCRRRCANAVFPTGHCRWVGVHRGKIGCAVLRPHGTATSQRSVGFLASTRSSAARMRLRKHDCVLKRPSRGYGVRLVGCADDSRLAYDDSGLLQGR